MSTEYETVDQVVDDDSPIAMAIDDDSPDVADAPAISDGEANTSAASAADVPQTQGSDVAPQVEHQQPQYDPQLIGAALYAGIDPRQYAPEQLGYAIQERYQRHQQQVAWAQQLYSDPAYQEFLRSRGQAGASPQAQGSAPAVSEEPFDYRKALQEAFTPPSPPPYAKTLLEQGLIAQSPTGKFIATDKGRTVVSPDELAAVNKFVDDVAAHESKRVEAIERALDARLNERLQEHQTKAQTEQHIRAHAAQYEPYVQNPAFGRPYLATLAALKDTNLPAQVRLQMAVNAGMAAVAPSMLEQARAHFQQITAQYGQPQPTQTYNAPQQVPQAQPQTPPQPPVSFIDRASQSPAGAGLGGGKPKRVYRHEADLVGIFDEAIARLQG